MRLSGNESRRYDDREPYGGMRERDDRGDSRDGEPRGGYGGQGGGMQQRERERDRERRHDDQWQCDGRRGRDMRDGGWHGGQGGGWRDERSGGQGRNDNGGGMQQRERGYDHGNGGGYGVPRHECHGNGGMSFTVETQGPARVGFQMGGSSMEHPDAERERERRMQRQAGEEERAAAHREQAAPEPARGERGQTQGDVWTGPVPQGASDDAVRAQRERIRGLIFRASAANQGLFGKLDDDLMTKVWGHVEMDVWTYAGVLAVVKKRPRWWVTLAETNTTLGALRRCGHHTLQDDPVGKLVKRAAKYGWLPRLARDVDEQDEQDEQAQYAELSGKFKTMVSHGDIGTVGKRADKVVNLFDSILRPGMARRFPRAAPAIALLKEAVERGWKLKLARDVAAMIGTAADNDSDDGMPDMS